MNNLLYLVSVILFVFWAIGFFAYHAGGPVHVLLIIAMFALMLRVIRG